MKTITSSQAKELMLAKVGAIFTAVFKKKDGSEREMRAELRPPKEDGGHSPAFYNPNLVVVGDVEVYEELLADGMSEQDATNHSYRSINTLTLLRLVYDGEEYHVEQE